MYSVCVCRVIRLSECAGEYLNIWKVSGCAGWGVAGAVRREHILIAVCKEHILLYKNREQILMCAGNTF